MGFLDKLKGAVNAVTGGAAKVQIEYQPQLVFPGDKLTVKVTATSTGGELKSKGCYVDLVGTEQIKLNQNTAGQHPAITHFHKTASHELQLAPAFTLAPNETKVFEGQITVPGGLQPSFNGTFVQHVWEVRGRLEAFGNDPDSGWQSIRVGLKA